MQRLLNFSAVFVQPQFSASLIFELRVDNASNYYVNLLYKNNYPGQAITLQPVNVAGKYILISL
jgi:hypothetical protein